MSVSFSTLAPSNLRRAKEKAARLADGAKRSIIYSFCGTAPIYTPPPALPYAALRPDDACPSDASLPFEEDHINVLKIAEALHMASPAFGLCEMLPENATEASSDKFVLSGVVEDTATVQEAAMRVSENCKELFLSKNTNTGKNVPDEKVVVDGVEAGATEYKSSAASSVDGLPQAYEAAAVMAAKLHQRLPLEDILIPFISYTAAEELHGVVYLLEGGAPCFAVLAISRLDTWTGCVEAARWRMALVRNGKRLAGLLARRKREMRRYSTRSAHVYVSPAKDSAAALHLEYYFLKRLPFEGGPPDIGSSRSMYHESLFQLELYEKLREGRVPAALPLARLTTGTGQLTSEQPVLFPPPVYFVFEDLAAQGFWSGLPNEEELFLPWLRGAMEAVRLTHAAGVVHLDTHMHNFMWRVQDGEGVVFMDTPPGAKPRGGWKARKDAEGLTNRRKAQSGAQAAAGGGGAAGRATTAEDGGSDGTYHVNWMRAGEVAAQARTAHEEKNRLAEIAKGTERRRRSKSPASQGQRKIDVLLVDWDHSLLLSRHARAEDVAKHSFRLGWCTSLRDLVADQRPPTNPDWDILRTTLALWLKHGPDYEAFRPLSRRDMFEDDWRTFATMHKETAKRLDCGTLGRADGLVVTLNALAAVAIDLDLNVERLRRLHDMLRRD